VLSVVFLSLLSQECKDYTFTMKKKMGSRSVSQLEYSAKIKLLYVLCGGHMSVHEPSTLGKSVKSKFGVKSVDVFCLEEKVHMFVHRVLNLFHDCLLTQFVSHSETQKSLFGRKEDAPFVSIS